MNKSEGIMIDQNPTIVRPADVRINMEDRGVTQKMEDRSGIQNINDQDYIESNT